MLHCLYLHPPPTPSWAPAGPSAVAGSAAPTPVPPPASRLPRRTPLPSPRADDAIARRPLLLPLPSEDGPRPRLMLLSSNARAPRALESTSLSTPARPRRLASCSTCARGRPDKRRLVGGTRARGGAVPLTCPECLLEKGFTLGRRSSAAQSIRALDRLGRPCRLSGAQR
jgi:hypothetical protein